MRATPNTVHPRPEGDTLLSSIPAVLRNRKGMLSVWGYTFHSWELLGLWAWLPAFLTAALMASGSSGAEAAATALSLSALTFSAIADSSVHSTVIAESVPPHILGAAYAVRSVLGFGTGVVSPVVFGWALDLAGGGRASGDAFAWGVAWATLGLGALLGPVATWRLQKIAK